MCVRRLFSQAGDHKKDHFTAVTRTLCVLKSIEQKEGVIFLPSIFRSTYGLTASPSFESSTRDCLISSVQETKRKQTQRRYFELHM